MKNCPVCTHQNPDYAGACESCDRPFDSKQDSDDTTFPKVDISEFSDGDMIADRYCVERELGQGGMGVVYLVRDTRLRERKVALKMIHSHLVAHPEAMQRFVAEMTICLDLAHSNIVRVYNLEDWGELQFFTMEYVPGRSLRDWINQRKNKQPAFSLPAVISIINPLLEALSYAHQHTIHRYIKPENIMVLGDFPDVQIKVLDFGIAKTMSLSRFTQTAHAMCTAYYMAPEQMEAAGEVDHRADLYSVGMVLYEMLTGKMAVGRFSLPGELVDDLPIELDAAIEKSLAPEPEERYENAQEMKEALSGSLVSYEKAIQQKEAKIHSLLTNARVALDLGQLNEADDFIGQILELDPENDQTEVLKQEAKSKKLSIETLFAEIEEYEQANRFEEAINLLNETNLIQKDDSRLQEVRERLEQKLLEKRKAEIEGLLRNGQLALAKCKWSEAEDFFSMLLKIDAEHSRAKNLLEEAKSKRLELAKLEKAAQTAEASKELEKAVSLLDEIIILSENKDAFEERKARLEKKLEEERHAEIAGLIEAGQKAMEHCRWPEAERHFRKVLYLDNSHEQVKAQLKESKEKSEKLQDLLKRAAEAEKKDDFTLAIYILDDAVPLSSEKEQLGQRMVLLYAKLDEKKQDEAERLKLEKEEKHREEQVRLEAEKKKEAAEARQKAETERQQEEQRAKKSKRVFLAKIVRWACWSFVLLVLCAFLAGAGTYFYLSENLPRITTLKDYRPPVITTVYSDDNRKIAEFYKERRIVVPLSKMPTMLKEAFVAAEDARFYTHKGIDVFSIIRAFFKNIEAGTIVQGGSTITQQVVKLFLLPPEKSYTSKLKEAILAYRIDKSFSKDEILFLYLNQIYLGHGAYGVEAASENYFGKPIQELNLAECAILAGLPQAPSRYSPFRHPERAKQRQIYTLNRMVAAGYITNIQATDAINQVLDIKPRRNWYIEEVPVYTEHIRRYLEKKYGAATLYKEGLRVYAAVDIEMQKAARREITKGLKALDKRQGYRGPLNHLAPEDIEAYSKELQEEHDEKPLEEGEAVKGVVIEVNDIEKTLTVRMGNALGTIEVKDMRWARKPDPEVSFYEDRVNYPGEVLSVGDVILAKIKGKIKDTDLWGLALEQKPKVQAALLCLETESGHAKAIVGGHDFRENQINRAIQIQRQPGTALQPIIYAAAIDKGYTPATMIIDSPAVFQDTKGDFTWKPKNYKEKFFGPILLRDALAKSRNVVTIKTLRDIGIDYAIDYARKLGITSRLSRDLSLALGSSGVSLLELVNAYSVFANSGYRVEPVFVTKIVDRDGHVIEEAPPVREKVIEKNTAYIMTSLLESVVKRGTGRKVRALGRPVAGKTGTTNTLSDAWFVGFTPRYVAGTWVGFDDEGSLGKSETGSKAASPIWLGFMKRILQDKPVRKFQVPEGIVFSKIDAETGLLPIPESTNNIFECFKEGTVPTEYTKPKAKTEQEDAFDSSLNPKPGEAGRIQSPAWSLFGFQADALKWAVVRGRPTVIVTKNQVSKEARQGR